MTLSARIFVPDTCDLGEGCFWWKERLWWVDIEGMVLHSVNGEGADRQTHSISQRIGVAMPAEDGRFVVGVEEGIGIWSLSAENLTLLHRPEAGRPASRFNDGKCDPAGRFVAGTLNMAGQRNSAALYQLREDGSLRTILAPVTLSNGLAWSADGATLYHIDTPTFEIASFSYDVATGDLGPRAVAVKIPESAGYPDGMCIDSRGNLWVAHWGGSAVRCWSPITGACLAEIPLPCAQPTCACFGGPGFDRLFITSARGGDEGSPAAGSVFECEPGVTGGPVTPCRLPAGV